MKTLSGTNSASTFMTREVPRCRGADMLPLHGGEDAKIWVAAHGVLMPTCQRAHSMGGTDTLDLGLGWGKGMTC